MLKFVNAAQAKAMLNSGALLVDIRKRDEFARENISGAINLPLSRIGAEKFDARGRQVIFMCKSGACTRGNAEKLAALSSSGAILDGGIISWNASGLATRVDRKQPIEVMRQVQIAAGSLVAGGIVLGWAINPALYALSGAVGLGLMFSGISGSCAMASVLRMTPWNRI